MTSRITMLKLTAAALLSLMLSACDGGGGGGSSTSIAIDTKGINFMMPKSMASLSQEVTVTFKGSTVVVGYAPKVTPANWLAVTDSVQTSETSITFTLTAISAAVQPGAYTTSVRFLTARIPRGGGEENARDFKFVDIPVTLTVPDLGVSTAAISTSVINGNESTGGSFNVLSEDDSDWTVSSNQPWLTIDTSSGSGAAEIGYTVNLTLLGNGVHSATIRVIHSATNVSLPINITVTVTPPDLVLSPEELTLTVGQDTSEEQLSLPLTLSDELGGTSTAHDVSWQVASIDAPWLSVTPSSGTSAPAAEATVTIAKDFLADLPNGTHTANITINYTTEDGATHSRILPITLELQLARVQWAAPYVVSAQRQYPIILRGSGFSTMGDSALMFADEPAATPTVVSDTEIHVSYPALPDGEFNVTIPNSLGLTYSARILVQNDGSRPAGTFAAEGYIRRLFLDNERNVLYGVDTHAYKLRRFALQDDAWTPLEDIVVAGNLIDAALSTDGSVLVMITQDRRIYELDLPNPNAEPQQIMQLIGDSYSNTYHRFSNIVFTNNSVALITQSFWGTGDTIPYLYDFRTNTLQVAPGSEGGLYQARAYASADGSTVLLPEGGLSPLPPIPAFNSSTNQVYFTDLLDNAEISMSRDGSVIMVGGNFYGQSLDLLASTFYSGTSRILVSPEGARAYIAKKNDYTGDPEVIDVFDLTNIAAGELTQLDSIMLPANIRKPGEFGFATAISGDGRTMFVWTSAALVVIPLPEP